MADEIPSPIDDQGVKIVLRVDAEGARIYDERGNLSDQCLLKEGKTETQFAARIPMAESEPSSTFDELGVLLNARLQSNLVWTRGAIAQLNGARTVCALSYAYVGRPPVIMPPDNRVTSFGVVTPQIFGGMMVSSPRLCPE